VGLHHFAAGEHLRLLFPRAPRDLMLANGNQTSPGAVISYRADGTLVLDFLTLPSRERGANVIDVCAAGVCG
jgi:hypothetical protein